MAGITVDAATASKLSEVDHATKLCDPSGKVLGEFVPVVDMSEWEPLPPEASEEELQRRENSTERRYTTAEVLAHLKGLEQK